MQSAKRLFGAQDMTLGSPMRCLIRFSVPLLIGNFAQQLYSTADSIIVGQFAPEKELALAAVGLTFPVINLLLVLFMAIATGAGIMVSQFFGAKDKNRLSRTVGNSLVLVALTSVAFTIGGILIAPWLLNVINTPPALEKMAYDYLVIILIGLFSSALFNIVSGILRGLGDSVWPLVFLLVAVILNVGLDLWFVIGFHMGVAGAAWATIISQAVSAVLCIHRLFKMRDIVEMSRTTIRIDKELSFQLLKLGMPAGIMQGIFSMAMLAVQNLANQMGPSVVATSTAVMRVDGFAMLPNFTFGIAVATFVGQNVGANRMDRVERGSKDALKLTLVVSSLLAVLLVFFGRPMVSMFTDSEQILSLGTRAFRILALGYVCIGAWQVHSGIMRGAGDTMPSMWISLIVNSVVRLPVAYLIAHMTKSAQWPNGSPDALYYSLLVSWISGAAVCYLWYRRGGWKNKSLVHTQSKTIVPQ